MTVQETKYVLQAKNIFDETKRVRYLMERTWDISKPSIAIIMYNPVRLSSSLYSQAHIKWGGSSRYAFI